VKEIDARAVFEPLLRAGRLNGMEMRNRIITGPMERSMANRDGTLTQTYVDYLRERARGGASLIVIESSYVDPRGLGHLYQVGCHGDHVIPGLRRAADAVHAEGAKLGIELYFGGRQTPSYMSQRQPLAPSVVVCPVLHPTATPRELTTLEIGELVQSFGRAAGRALEAGLDMIHLHGAHGYLLGAFLSPFSNRRTDRYGGELEGRARFGLEVLDAVRTVVGAQVPVGYRISADEYVEGGLTVDDTAQFAVLLAGAGVDLVDVSGGIYESAHMIIQGPEAPNGGFVVNARRIKQAVGAEVAVSVGQRLGDPYFAAEILRGGDVDYVTLSRAFHADPSYVRRLEEGRSDEIIPCIACHHCTNLLEANRPARCAANPLTGLERRRRLRRVTAPRRIVVVGGGIGGMQAARLLALQGNRVRLYEQSSALGGQVRYSARVASDYGRLADFLARELTRLGVDVQIGVAASLGGVRDDRPDGVVVATGAGGGQASFSISSAPRKLVDLFGAFDEPDDAWTGRAVIAGGDSESCFLALHIAGRGGEVFVVEPKSGFSDNKLSPGRDLLMRRVNESATIRLRPETTIEEVGEGHVVLQRRGSFEELTDVSIVVVGGRCSNNRLGDELVAELTDVPVLSIGDCVEPRDVYCASHEAAEVAELLGT